MESNIAQINAQNPNISSEFLQKTQKPFLNFLMILFARNLLNIKNKRNKKVYTPMFHFLFTGSEIKKLSTQDYFSK